jgi:hypothetical protein
MKNLQELGFRPNPLKLLLLGTKKVAISILPIFPSINQMSGDDYKNLTTTEHTDKISSQISSVSKLICLVANVFRKDSMQLPIFVNFSYFENFYANPMYVMIFIYKKIFEICRFWKL